MPKQKKIKRDVTITRQKSMENALSIMYALFDSDQFRSVHLDVTQIDQDFFVKVLIMNSELSTQRMAKAQAIADSFGGRLMLDNLRIGQVEHARLAIWVVV